MRALLEQFGHHRLNAQQEACASLPRLLDEYNWVATNKTATLCPQSSR
jgi:hypothetical protein